MVLCEHGGGGFFSSFFASSFLLWFELNALFEALIKCEIIMMVKVLFVFTLSKVI